MLSASLTAGRSHVDDLARRGHQRRCSPAASWRPPTRGAGCGGHHRDLRADAAVRGRRARSARGHRSDDDDRSAAGARHPGGPGVHHLPRHDRDRSSDRCWRSAPGSTAGTDFQLAFSPERVDPGNTRYTIENTPKVVGGLTTESTAAAEAFYASLRGAGRGGQGHPRGRDREAAGEHVPPREHRPGQRDGPVLPRDGHRPVGRDPAGEHKALRFPAVLPRAGRGRALHPDRPELPQPCRPVGPRLPVPVRRAGAGDQRHDAGLRRPPRAERAERRGPSGPRLVGAAARA